MADSVAALGEVARHPSVDRAVSAVRDLLGMDIAYSTRFTDTHQIFEVLKGDGGSFGVNAGSEIPLEATYCSRILAGELPAAMSDVRANGVARAMPITARSDVGAYISVPMKFSNGIFYGTLCAASHKSLAELGNRELQFMHVFARIIADEIEREALAGDLEDLRTRAASIEALLAAVEARDSYTGEHSRAVVANAGAVARELGLGAAEMADVEHVALLHDLGKLAVPDYVLDKPTALTRSEWELMREHPEVGARIIASISGLEHLAPAIRAEHERWDGDGYPLGLAGEAIPLAARITLVCDAYDAMTTDRPYRSAMSHDDAMSELQLHTGTQFCGACVEALVAVLSRTVSVKPA